MSANKPSKTCKTSALQNEIDMSSPSIVRRATPEDRDSIWTLFHLLHAENGIFPLSEPKVDWLLDRVLHPENIPEGDNGLRGYMGVIGPPNKCEGFILVSIGNFWYSTEPHLEEFANFVHPAHRNSNHAKTLLGWSKQLSDRIGIPLLIGIVSNTRTEAKVRLYRRQLPSAGNFFLYNAATGTNSERKH